MGFIKYLAMKFISMFKKKQDQPPVEIVHMPRIPAVESPKILGESAVPPFHLVLGDRPKDLPEGGHYGGTNVQKLAAEYAYIWKVAKITQFEDQALDAAKTIFKHKDRYQAVANHSRGMPYWFVGLIHHMEASFDFSTALHNGDRIIGTGQKTTHVPAGRGPFSTWEEGALDALKERLMYTEWSVPSCFRRLESYNGMGYRGPAGQKTTPKFASAYTFAGTQFFVKGRYIADHQFDPEKPETRPGCMAVLIKLVEIDATLANIRA